MIKNVLFLLSLGAIPWLAAQPGAAAQEPASSSGYVLGPDDQIVVRALDGLDTSDKPVLIGLNGNITLPLIGRVKAAGLTVEQLENELTSRLKKYVQDPQISVTVVEFRSEPVSVFGAVTQPGVFQLRGRKTLYQVLSMAGGPRETAGSTVTITRLMEYGPIPLAAVVPDPTGRYSTAELDLQEIFSGKNAAANIEIKPYDVISVSQANASVIYVVGDVEHAGAFSLGPQNTLTVLDAISLAGGPGRTAKLEQGKVFRAANGEQKREVLEVNIKQIMAGKQQDVGLHANDVLVVPTSSRKVFTTLIVPGSISGAVSAAIYAGTVH